MSGHPPPSPPQPKQLFVDRRLQQAQSDFQAGRHAQASSHCLEVLNRDRKNPDALHILAAIAAEQDRYVEAETLIRQAIALRPACPHCRNTLGNIQRAQRKMESAIESYRRALSLDPGQLAARLGLAQALENTGELQGALAEVTGLLAIDPNFAQAHALLGGIRSQQGRLAEASEHFARALELGPNLGPTHRGFGLHLLRLGELAEGWNHYRLSLPGSPAPDVSRGAEVFRDKHVFVYGDEGVGDEILCASCFPDLLDTAVRFTSYCDPRLKPLFERSFAKAEFVPVKRERKSFRRTWRPNEVLLTSDLLPAYFRPDFASFPARLAYLEADHHQRSQWRKRLHDMKRGLRVGIAWSGGATPHQRQLRTIPLQQWLPVLAVPGINFVSLQHGDTAKELQALCSEAGVTVNGFEEPNPLKDLDGFAALISALDLVICVSNTTAHLAGALGVPVWTLVPVVDAWHWFLDRTDSPWYPSMRLFRQTQEGAWKDVLSLVEADLRHLSLTNASDSEVA